MNRALEDHSLTLHTPSDSLNNGTSVQLQLICHAPGRRVPCTHIKYSWRLILGPCACSGGIWCGTSWLFHLAHPHVYRNGLGHIDEFHLVRSECSMYL